MIFGNGMDASRYFKRSAISPLAESDKSLRRLLTHHTVYPSFQNLLVFHDVSSILSIVEGWQLPASDTINRLGFRSMIANQCDLLVSKGPSVSIIR